jgi:hypothetical protein
MSIRIMLLPWPRHVNPGRLAGSACRVWAQKSGIAVSGAVNQAWFHHGAEA